ALRERPERLRNARARTGTGAPGVHLGNYLARKRPDRSSAPAGLSGTHRATTPGGNRSLSTAAPEHRPGLSGIDAGVPDRPLDHHRYSRSPDELDYPPRSEERRVGKECRL